MMLKGEDLARAYNELAQTEPVRLADIEDDPQVLAFLGAESYVYPVSVETSDALLPLMSKRITGYFEYNGSEYEVDTAIMDVRQIHRKGKRYFQFPGGAEEIAGWIRLREAVDAIYVTERERWERATGQETT